MLLSARGKIIVKQGPDSIKRCHLTSIGNPIVEIRRSHDRLISTMGFPIPVRCHLYIESGPRSIQFFLSHNRCSNQFSREYLINRTLHLWRYPHLWRRLIQFLLLGEDHWLYRGTDVQTGNWNRADSRFAPRQWKTVSLCNDVLRQLSLS